MSKEMSIAAFILSLLAGILATFQGGCACVGGGALSQYSREAERMGVGGFLLFTAAIVGFVGGAMAFTRKPRAKILLGISSGISLLAALMGFTDGILYCVIYGIAAFLAHRDTNQQSVQSASGNSSSNSKPATEIKINIDFQWLKNLDFLWLKGFISDFIAHFIDFIHRCRYISAKKTKIASIAIVALQLHIYNPIFWLACFLKYKKYKYADEVLFGSILSLFITARLVKATNFLSGDDFFYAMKGLAIIPIVISLFFLGLHVIFIYSVEKFLDGDNRFKWPAHISNAILALFFILFGFALLNDYFHLSRPDFHEFVLGVGGIISFALSTFVFYSLVYLNKNKSVKTINEKREVPQTTNKEIVAPTNTASTSMKINKTASLLDLSKEGFELLKTSKFERARQNFDQLLSRNPKISSACIGKLMAIHRVKSANELVALPIRLEEEELFRKALECATPKMKETLLKYIQINNTKNSRKKG